MTAPSLKHGVEQIRRALGVEPQPGGKHPGMGTHNCVLNLGSRIYLEVIAIDPEAPEPDRPRWFQLDKPGSRPAVQLATWVVRTNDIQAAVSASPIPSGRVEPMTRGQFNWQITIPEDGGLPLGGIAPTLIQWQSAHPAGNMKDSGCSLIRLEGFHSEAKNIKAMLESVNFEGDFSVSAIEADKQPHLIAHINTPAGARILCNPRF